MSLWVDKKYANMIALRLEQFKLKRQEPYIANFRCPYCGDSDKNSFKARGYFVGKGQKILFFCHNCGKSTTLGKVLELLDPLMYSEWRLENLKEMGQTLPRCNVNEHAELKPNRRLEKFGKNPLFSIDNLLDLQPTHPARVYVDSRRIPLESQARIHYADDFNAWVSSIKPDVPHRENKEGRLIIPFLDEHAQMFGFQGRSLDPKSAARYLTFMLEDGFPKVYGLDMLDKEAKNIWIVEGPIDSMFMPPNTIAMAGSDADPSRFAVNPSEQCIFVYDNEPRSREILRKMVSRINQGFRVVIWPNSLEGQKDINDMILNGLSREELFAVLNQNTFHGIEATLRFGEWKKINNNRRYVHG